MRVLGIRAVLAADPDAGAGNVLVKVVEHGAGLDGPGICFGTDVDGRTAVIVSGVGGLATLEANAVARGRTGVSPYMLAGMLPGMGAAYIAIKYGIRGYSSCVAIACAADRLICGAMASGCGSCGVRLGTLVPVMRGLRSLGQAAGPCSGPAGAPARFMPGPARPRFMITETSRAHRGESERLGGSRRNNAYKAP